MSKFDRARLLIFLIFFALVFVSRDFEVGRNVSCEESTVVHNVPSAGGFRCALIVVLAR